jgi:hypothetical protein
MCASSFEIKHIKKNYQKEYLLVYLILVEAPIPPQPLLYLSGEEKKGLGGRGVSFLF